MRREKALRILGVVIENSDAELNLPARLVDPLAHLQRHRMSEFVGFCVHECRRLGNDDGPFGITLVPPSLVTCDGSRDFGFEFFVGHFFKLLQQFARRGVEALVGHALVLFNFFRCVESDRDGMPNHASMITLRARVLAACPKVS